MAAPDARSGADAQPWAQRRRLLALLESGDLDAALQAGLMRYAAGDGAEDASLRGAQEQLRTAWAARERHRVRAERLERQVRQRDARRAARPTPATVTMTPATAPQAPATLPPAAAAALARARAKATGQGR